MKLGGFHHIVLSWLVVAFSSTIFYSTASSDNNEVEAKDVVVEDVVEIFTPGNLYRYNYATTLHLQRASFDTSKVGTIHYKIHARLTVEAFKVTENSRVLKITLSNLSVLNMLSEQSETHPIDKTFAPIFVVRFIDGTVDRIHVDASLSPDWINILKGIANSFNYRTVQWEGREIDTSGDCQTKYGVETTFLVKRKSNCLNTDLSVERDAWHDVLSIDREDEIVAKYIFNDNSQMQSMTASEYHKIHAIIDPDIGALIRSNQFLTLSDVEKLNDKAPTLLHLADLIKQEKTIEYKEVLLSTTIKPKSPLTKEIIESTLKQEITNLSPDELATLNSSRSFLKLISQIRHFYNKDELNRIINQPVFSDIKLQFLDALAACQTGTCFSALMDQLQFDNAENEDIHERILFSMSFMTMPNEQFIEELFHKVKKSNFVSDSVKSQASLTLGTIVGKFGKSKVGKYSEVIKKISAYFHSSLKACVKEDCRVMYLGAMKNSRFAESIPELLEFLHDNSTTRVKVMIMKVLSSIDIPDKDKHSIMKQLFDLFYRPTRNIDNSIKIQAFDLLFQLDAKVQQLVQLCRFERNNTDLIKPLLERLSTWESMEILTGATTLLKTDPLLNNYHSQSFRTLSTYQHGLLSEGQAHALEFELSMLSSSSGVIKESNLDVSLTGTNGVINFLSVNLFASGIDSLVGESTEKSEGAAEQEEVTAGMVISVLGKSLRPVKFFTGQSGLMSAVWNAPSSPVSALQGLLLLLDFQSTVHLQNGLVLMAHTEGGLSFDLTGSIDISLWNRNSASVVRNAGALVIHSEIQLTNDLFNVSFHQETASETHTDFSTNINFAVSPMRMCLQMIRPDVKIQKSIRSLHSIPEHTKLTEEVYRTKLNIPGISYAFGEQNNRICAMQEE